MVQGTSRGDRATARVAMPMLAALAAGIVHGLSFAPIGSGTVQILALAGLVGLIARRSARRAALLGFCFGLGWFCAGVSWVWISMHVYGGMPSAIAAVATLGFAAYLALFPAMACWTYRRVAGGVGPAEHRLAQSALFAASLTLCELLRGWFLTGFPWLAPGYAHIDSWLQGWAPLAGVHAVGWAGAWIAALLALTPLGPCRRAAERSAAAGSATSAGSRAWLASAALAGALIGAPLLAQRVDLTVPHGAPLSILLVQGNVPQALKFDPPRALRALSDYRDRILAQPAQLAVLPETAWTVFWQNTPPEVIASLKPYLAVDDRRIAIGMPMLATDAQSSSNDAAGAESMRGHISNSVGIVAADPGGEPRIVARYDKRKLVPFGEFVPFGFRWFVDMMNIPLGEFARGSADQAPVPVIDQRVSFNICYEDAFGALLLPALRRADDATILINVTNIGWFGDSLILPQHLQIARMRALETGRPVLRASNTGITASIDHRGQVQARLPAFEAASLRVDVQGRTGPTPFARFGNWPLLAAALLIIGVAARVSRRPAPRQAR